MKRTLPDQGQGQDFFISAQGYILLCRQGAAVQGKQNNKTLVKRGPYLSMKTNTVTAELNA